MDSNDTDNTLQAAVIKLIKPLIRVLLRNGISFGVFAEWVKRAFVEVAHDEFGIPNKKQTTTRVSTLTGLTRKETQRLLDQPHCEDAVLSKRYNRAARVISAWVREKAFHDGRGQPAALPFDGDEKSFSALVKFASGDITPRTILDELERLNVVSYQGNNRIRLLSRAYIPQTDSLEKIAILGTDVADLIKTIDHNITCTPEQSLLQRKVSYDNIPDDLVANLHAKVVKKAQAALEDMDRAMAKCDRDANPKVKGTGRKRVGIGIYYFEDDTDENTES